MGHTGLFSDQCFPAMDIEARGRGRKMSAFSIGGNQCQLRGELGFLTNAATATKSALISTLSRLG